MNKLLCIVGGMNAGGAETFLMKIYRELDKNKYQMDFCVTSEKEGFYDKEIIQMGGNIYKIKSKTKNPIRNFMDIKRIVKNNKYNNVIRISQNSISTIDLLAAKLGGAKNTIFRSSNSDACSSLIANICHYLFRPISYMIPKLKVAPSDKAAIFMFGSRNFKKGNVLILNNSFDLKKYEFDELFRDEIRSEFNIPENSIIIGHVGRFSSQKNHVFIIDLATKILEKNKNVYFFLIGVGELEKDIKETVKKNKIEKNVIFLGVREDVNKLYSAFDIFILPSLYEGMPNCVLEAQVSGLTCLVSNRITEKVNITDNVKFLDISTINEWYNQISNINLCNRINKTKVLKANNYDIKDYINTVCKYFFK